MSTKLALYIIGLVLLVVYIQSKQFQGVVEAILPFKLLAAFIGGALYTSFITAPIGIIIFLTLAKSVDPLFLALVGSIGGLLVDLLLVKTFQRFLNFLSISSPAHFSHRSKALLKKYHFNAVAIIIGALIIISPFPDEFGLVLLGAGRLNTAQLSIVLFVLGFIAIYLLTSLARVII